MREFYRLFQIMKSNPQEKYALATIVSVRGSSYRKEGAKMLIGLDGLTYGTISGGCLEEDLYYRAIEVIESSTPNVVTYDLMSEDDLGWGQGAGCNGVIDVYVEPFYWSYPVLLDDFSIYHSLANEIEKKKEIISAITINTEQPLRYYYSSEGELIGRTESPVEMASYIKSFNQRDLYFESVNLMGGNQTVILEKYKPKENLYIFGAGPDTEPLVKLAANLDFSITVIDPRGNRCNKDNFKAADALVVEFPSTFLLNHNIEPESYVIIMTHNFERDKSILCSLMNHPLKYLGILGPRRRTKRLVSPHNIPEHIHSPIGLNIDAEGAEEISFSILAELIQVRNSKERSAVQI